MFTHGADVVLLLCNSDSLQADVRRSLSEKVP